MLEMELTKYYQSPPYELVAPNKHYDSYVLIRPFKSQIQYRENGKYYLCHLYPEEEVHDIICNGDQVTVCGRSPDMNLTEYLTMLKQEPRSVPVVTDSSLTVTTENTEQKFKFHTHNDDQDITFDLEKYGGTPVYLYYKTADGIEISYQTKLAEKKKIHQFSVKYSDQSFDFPDSTSFDIKNLKPLRINRKICTGWQMDIFNVYISKRVSREELISRLEKLRVSTLS